jgi:hypothetical protein
MGDEAGRHLCPWALGQPPKRDPLGAHEPSMAGRHAAEISVLSVAALMLTFDACGRLGDSVTPCRTAWS